MSFSATALRIAAVEALRPASALAGTDVFPTIAGAAVFDSRIVALADLKKLAVPSLVVGVFSEAVSIDSRGAAYPLAPGVVQVDLAFEIDVLQGEKDGDVLLGPPLNTDAAWEVKTDFLVAQIRKVLTTGPSGAIFRKVAKQILGISSAPFRIPELGVRLTRRTMVVKCAVSDEAWSLDGGLPEPLKTVADLLPQTSPATTVLAAVAAAIGAETPGAALEAIDIGFGGEPPETLAAAPVRASVRTTPEED